MTSAPAYLSQEVYNKLTEDFVVGRRISTITYEEGSGGILRTVAGYFLSEPGNRRIIADENQKGDFVLLAPIQQADGSPRNRGKRVTALLVPVCRVVTIEAVFNA